MKIHTRRGFARIPLLTTVFLAIAMFAVVGLVLAQVDDLGLFALDGNASTGNTNSGYGSSTETDWQCLEQNTCTSNAGFQEWTGILPSDLTSAPSPTSFTTGGSKDINNISSWRWTTGSVPNKDAILHAYAAAYTAPATNGAVSAGDLVIYFGADRYDTGGSAQIGFWFLQNSVAPATGGTFSSTHAVGDLLVIANFNVGGSLANYEVLKWVGTGGDQKGGTLQTVVSSSTAACQSGDATTACAISNTSPAQLYWDFAPEFPVTGTFPQGDCTGSANCAPSGAFFEGGIDVTALLGSTPCLGTYLVETRSSTSVSAELEDFITSSFKLCQFTVGKACGPYGNGTNGVVQEPGIADGSYVKYQFGGVVQNTGVGTLTDVTVTDTFPSDATNITPTSSCSSSNVCSYDVGSLAAGQCKEWPSGNVVACSTSLGQLFANGDFNSDTYDTQMNGASNLVSNAVADGATVTTITPLPVTATCMPAPAPSFSALKTCTSSISAGSSTLVITVTPNGSVCNESGFTISNLSASDAQTDSTYLPLSGASSQSLTLLDNNGNATTTLQPCPSGVTCSADNQTTYPNTCATFDTSNSSYSPSTSTVSGPTCPGDVTFYDQVTITGNYLGGSGTMNRVTTQADASCGLCSSCSSGPVSAATATTSTAKGKKH